MAGRIRDEDIAAVRERSPVDEVIGELARSLGVAASIAVDGGYSSLA